jgi:hypothetical protein
VRLGREEIRKSWFEIGGMFQKVVGFVVDVRGMGLIGCVDMTGMPNSYKSYLGCSS